MLLQPGALLKRAAPAALAASSVLAIQATPIPETLNLLLYDLQTSVNPARPASGEPLAIITIAESDIRAYGWPIDDNLLCGAIDRLTEAGVQAIGLDLYRDQGVGPNQACLRQRVRSNPRLVSIFNVAEGIPPIPGTPPEQRGYNDLVLDPDGVLRRDLLHVAGQDASTVSLPMRLLEVASGSQTLRRRIETGADPGPWLSGDSGGYDRLDASGFQQMLTFRQLGSVPSFTLRQLLSSPGIAAEQLRGRIVLIGSSAASLRDLFSVPQTRLGTTHREAALLVPGVEIHAHRLMGLLDRQRQPRPARMITLDGWGKRSLLIGCLLLGLLLGEGFASLRRSVLITGLTLVALGGGVLALLSEQVWVGPTLPLVGLTLMAGAGWVRRGVASQQQRQQFEKLLGQTTSPAVARQLWQERDTLLADGRFEGRQVPVTVLMLDICGFTGVSEKLSPALLLDWLNRAMGLFVPAVTDQGGMVNKFTGDGLLAVYGAPLSQGQQADATAAIRTALAIQEQIEALNDQLASDREPAVRVRIGIHSGEVVAGSLGSQQRLEYAVIGDTVNCAARLESLDKTRHDTACRVLASSSTYAWIGAAEPLRWQLWGAIQVKGREQPLQIWELRGRLREDSEPEPAPANPA